MSLLLEIPDLPNKNNSDDKLAVIMLIVIVALAAGYMASQAMQKPEPIIKNKPNQDERK